MNAPTDPTPVAQPDAAERLADLGETFLQRILRLFLQADMALVRFITALARPTLIRASAVGISNLGNGSVYLILSAFVLERLGKSGLPVIVVAGCNVAVLHCFYPYMKRRVGRVRPFQADPALHSISEVLDEHSFPSGHTMTLAASLAPIIYVTPGSALPGIGVIVAMAWARVATAHHYPSDVCAGAMLGGSLGYATARYCLISI